MKWVHQTAASNEGLGSLLTPTVVQLMFRQLDYLSVAEKPEKLWSTAKYCLACKTEDEYVDHHPTFDFSKPFPIVNLLENVYLCIQIINIVYLCVGNQIALHSHE